MVTGLLFLDKLDNPSDSGKVGRGDAAGELTAGMVGLLRLWAWGIVDILPQFVVLFFV